MKKLSLILFTLVSVLLLTLAVPREGKFVFEYKEGTPWKYAPLIADFEFPIIKSEKAIKMEKDRQGRLCGFIVEGHADYAEEGSDIVCAAVSALTQTALLGIIRYAGEEKVVYEQSEGFLAAHTLSFVPEVPIVLETVVSGLNEIARQYPEYVVLT